MRGNRPSHTAIKIAKAMAYVAGDPRLNALLPEGAARWSERLATESGFFKPWEKAVYGQEWFRHAMAFVERHTMPGGTLHVVLRKRFLDEETRDALGHGATQVLSLGAGLDTLCLRLSAEYPQVIFVEMDHPATHLVKRDSVRAVRGERPNLYLVGADLATARLEDTLPGRIPWRVDAASVVVAEGVLMYLRQRDVTALLAAIRQITRTGSRFLFTYLRADEAGRMKLGRFGFLTRVSLQMIGEPLRWAVHEAQLPTFLQQRSYRLDTSEERCDLRRRFLRPQGMADCPLGDVEGVGVAETLA